MSKNELKQFLIEANKAGYAGGEEKKWLKETDGSTTIRFEEGEWQLNDNFFGGEPYGGRTIVFYKNKPIWIMTYYGWVVEGTETNSVYQILKEALMHMPKDYPFRGPEEYKQGEFVYTNSWEGDVNRFSGQEQIVQNGKLVYEAHYLGGFVNKSK